MLMIDSNIWAYYFDDESPEHKSVFPKVSRALKEEVVVNTVVVIEVAHFLVKNLGPVLGREKLDVFLSFPITIDELNAELVKASIDELCRYSHLGIGGRDSTLLASMRRMGVDKIMTHDKAFKQVPGVKVIDPVS